MSKSHSFNRGVQPFVFAPVSIVPGKVVDREKLLSHLREAARSCNLLSSGKQVPGFYPGRTLTVEESELLKIGMDHLSFMLETVLVRLRPTDFMVDKFCDCEITVKCLLVSGIITLSDIIDSKHVDYLSALSAAKMYGAQKQWHLVALAKGLSND